MKRAAAVLLAVAAVSAAGIAYAATTPSGFSRADTVFGGGHFVIAGTSASENFSITATNGTGTLVSSQGQIVAQITCLNVSGNVAVVVGTVRSSANGGSLDGSVVEMYFEDNGQPSSGGSVGGDDVSPLFLPSSPPKTCPAADISNAPGGVSPLDAGDIAVHAKGS
jgi:hypothetical protein